MKMNRIMCVVLTLVGFMFVTVPSVKAEESKGELKASATIHDILMERVGKRTTIRLQSGEDIEGIVTMVGNSLLHITKLTGKDFYDAVISIDKINGVIMRVRER